MISIVPKIHQDCQRHEKYLKKYNDLDNMPENWAICGIGIHTSLGPFSPKGENLEEEPISLALNDKKWK